MENQRILLLVDKFGSGGAERQIFRLASLLQKKSKTVFLSSLEDPSPKWLDEFHHKEISYVKLTNTAGKNVFHRILRFPLVAFRIRKFCLENNIDTFISFLEWSNVINVLSSARLKIRTMVSVRNHLSSQYSIRPRFLLGVARAVLPIFYNKAQYVICNSSAIKEDLCDRFRVEEALVKVLYNISSDKTFELDRLQPTVFTKTAEDKLRFIACGRICKQKRMLGIARTFDAYVTRTGRVQDELLLVGEGPGSQNLISFIEEVSSNIELEHFSSFLNNEFLNRDCIIVNSEFEGFPNVLFEAVSVGCFSISVDCLSGPREILSDFEWTDYSRSINELVKLKNGLLVPQSDCGESVNDYLVEALEHSVENLLNRKGSKRIEWRFSKIGRDQWEDFIKTEI